MRLHLATFLAAALLASPLLAAETRCGWLHNPSPANWWLDDADGSWTLMSQGAGEGPPGIDLISDISARDYVETNGAYGYACACMSVTTDDAEGSITKILSFRQLALSKCQNDAALSPPQ